MDTREVAKEYRITQWGHIIRARNESGLSIKAFCVGEGIHESVYYYWQRKLREVACERLGGMQAEAVDAIAVTPRFAVTTPPPLGSSAKRRIQKMMEVI